MTKTVLGIVRGRSIDLAEDLGLRDGQSVEVSVTPVKSPATWGEGIRRSAGGWADADEIDAVMEQIAADRKRDRRPQ